MSDFGIFASRLQFNNQSLEEFENALTYLRLRQLTVSTEQDVECINKIQSVLKPIVENLHGVLSDSMLIDDKNMVEILRRRQSHNWQTYKQQLFELSQKISSNQLTMTKVDFSVLNDIADAMEIECSKLFRRMRRFP